MIRFVTFMVLFASAGALAQPARLAARRDSTDRSELILGLARENRTFFLGREFGQRIPNYAPTLSYTHRTGLYVNAEGFYSDKNQPAPHYYFTEVEVGYANQLMNRLTYSVSYNRVFFTKETAKRGILPIRNGVEAYAAYDFGPVNLGVDYTYYFDQQHAQLLTATLGSTVFRRRNWLGFSEVSLTPAVSAYWGTYSTLLRYGGLYGTGVVVPRVRKTTTPASGTTTGGTVHHHKGTVTTGDSTATGTQTTNQMLEASTHYYPLGAELTVPLSLTWRRNSLTISNHTILTTKLPNQTAPQKLINFLSIGVQRTFR